MRHQEGVRRWLRDHYHHAITEDEYIAAMKKLRENDSGKRARRNRCPSNLRHHYRMLNEKFGFFMKEQEK